MAGQWAFSLFVFLVAWLRMATQHHTKLTLLGGDIFVSGGMQPPLDPPLRAGHVYESQREVLINKTRDFTRPPQLILHFFQ